MLALYLIKKIPSAESIAIGKQLRYLKNRRHETFRLNFTDDVVTEKIKHLSGQPTKITPTFPLFSSPTLV